MKNNNIPLYKGKGIFGIASDFLKNSAQFTHEQESEMGDFYRLRLLHLPVFVTFRPEVIQHVLQSNAKKYQKSPAYGQLKLALGNGLVTSEGKFWRRQRRMAQPAFYKARLEQLLVDMSSVIDDYIQDLNNRILSSATLDVSKEMMKVTADVVLRTLFSTKNDQDEGQMYQMMADIQEYVMQRVTHPLQRPLQYLNGNHRRFKKQRQTFNASIYDLIAQRRLTEDRPADLLSMLLDATDAETGEHMTDEQLRDEAITIFAAGHETSANALAWTLHLLAQHPEMIERLRTEERNALDGRTPNFSDLHQLIYHKQVIEEGMRLYPPAHAIGRQAVEADEINGIPVPKNSIIYISVYALHRSPKYWEQPEQFNPDRFAPEQVKQQPKLTYLPFGAGARMCIGNHFAMMEMQLLLAKLIRHFDFERISDKKVEFLPLVTLKPKEGIRLICKRIS